MLHSKGIIFDIEHGSLVDGPGIRTTVFFKGCNLKCTWCHNPESQSFNQQMMFYKDKCISCGNCKKVCHLNFTSCDFCRKCEIFCPKNARKICGREMTAQEVYTEIIKDKDFYEVSNGGVTFSGGECMLQMDFLTEILVKCKENGVHTAIDTAGHVPFESFERVLPYTDLFLYDIKLADSKKHKEFTGVDNHLIINNLKKLSETGKKIIVRVPIICEVNDNEKELNAIAKILKDLNVVNIELLPYHKMGEAKYSALGLKPVYFEIPSKEQMGKFKHLFGCC